MKPHTLRRTGGIAAVAATLSLSLAACGNDSNAKSSDSPTPTSSAPAANAMDAGAQVFGDACSSVPADGKGSFNGMVTDPVGTAASNNPLLGTLVAAAGAADLVDTLNSAEALTVFAPTDDAFAKIPEADLNAVLADKATLTKILLHHVIAGQLDPEAVVGTQDTLNKDTVTVEGDTFGMTVEGANVLCGNIPTGNATVYVIDSVLMPS
ncbi:MAG: Cell surface lipoprotein precursor [Nocardioides sp.]|nr:Cell surface lipoprotein precursor [Nocardioides sp.]